LADSDAKRSIVDDLTEMETMVTAILDAARTQNADHPIQTEPTDMNRLVGELVKTMADTPPGMVFTPSPQAVVIRVDPRQIATAVKNLMENALKYAADQPEPVAVSIQRDIGQVIVAVADCGIGIPAAEQRRIFEPFYRVDQSRTRKTGGFGLGLSICKNIVEAHSGKIRLDSRPGAGTTVWVVLPDNE